MTSDEFFEGVEAYIAQVRKELHARWDAWQPDPEHLETHETIGGLMARQVTLVTQMAMNPGIWNGHIAPLLLRSMVDTFITFAWIWGDPNDRARKYIHHGLGQEKLLLEHYISTIGEDEGDPEDDPFVQARRSWIDSQRWTFLTDVNLGSWSGKSTRAMAQEADCMGIYNHAYQPFSTSAHSMWNHVAKYNLQYCENPLHRNHRVPVDPELDIDPDYLYRASKYVARVFETFDDKSGVDVSVDSGFELLYSLFKRFGAESEPPEDGTVD
ncbi:MAG: DUF5677 domain-containing protein [Bacteroidota bacterium]